MSGLSKQQYRHVFESAAGKILLLDVGSQTIVAATRDYLNATWTRAEDIVGRHIFDVFPDDPEDPNADGSRNLSESLERVLAFRSVDVMAVQKYPIPKAGGGFEERYWSVVNSPVIDDSGNIEFIAHRVEDVTEVVLGSKAIEDLAVGDAEASSSKLQDIILRSRDLRQSLSRLQESEAKIRTAEALLDLGSWEYDFESRTVRWSERASEIFGISKRTSNLGLSEFLDLLHPEDRDSARRVFEAFEIGASRRVEFEHRVVKPNGDLAHIRGVGERCKTWGGEIGIGFFQDITPQIRTRQSLDKAEQLIHLAGDRAHLGGWRVDLASSEVFWTAGTAAIHDRPPDYSPHSLDEAIAYYSPEYRETIEEAFTECARQGVEFDVVCQLITAGNRRVWVRAVGTPEYDADHNIVAVQGAFQDISDLKEAQDQVLQAEEKRLDMIESISDAFYALDRNWNFSYLNRQAELQLQRSREELVGKNVWTEFPEAVGSKIEESYVQAMQEGRTIRFEEYYEPLDKEFEINAYPIPEGLAVYFRDVTRDRDHQKQLQLVQAALSRQNDVVLITEAAPLDPPHGPRIVYVNEAIERVTGYSADEVIGRTPRIFQGTDTDKAELKRIRQALEKQQPIRTQLINYAKHGRPYWSEIDISPLTNDEGHCTHYVAFQRDITERKEQEQELVLSQERFRLISRATNDVIWDWDLHSDTVWWNDSMQRVFGHAAEDLEEGPESWVNRIHPEDFERVYQSIREVIESSEELWSKQYRFARSDGTYAMVMDRGFVMRDSKGKALRMIGSMEDITERIELEERLRESQKLEAVGHLTGGVAHDFNNLLTVIIGSSEELVERLSDPSQKQMAKLAVSAAERGAELTSRLLAFARRQPLDPRLVDINALTVDLQSLFERTLPENIELVMQPDARPLVTEIDANELETALLNLVVNARDAMRLGGKITIESSVAWLDDEYALHHPQVVPGEYILISVSDTGTGIDRETLARVFEPFFTTKKAGHGSGLGLSMVFGFTKQSGGHIEIYSEPGEGTTVKLYFRRSNSANTEGGQDSVSDVTVGGHEHILVAEDDALVRKHVAEQLRSLGYRVTTVASGPEAQEILSRTSDIDLLLTDIIMPGGMNGKELASWAVARDPGLKVLFTSGYTENAIVHHGRLDPGVELLTKPYRRQELAAKLRSVLDSRAG